MEGAPASAGLGKRRRRPALPIFSARRDCLTPSAASGSVQAQLRKRKEAAREPGARGTHRRNGHRRGVDGRGAGRAGGSGHAVRQPVGADPPVGGGRPAGGDPGPPRTGPPFQSVARALPREHLRPEETRRDAHPGERGDGEPPGDHCAARPGDLGPGDRQDPSAGQDVLRSSSGARGVRLSVLPGPEGGADRERDGP